MSSRGIVYSATGQRYVAEAVASALSSLRFNTVPHVIFCDQPPATTLHNINFSQFSSCGNGYLDKIDNIARTPFENTIFLDTDTYVLDEVDGLFDLLQRFDIAAAQAPGYTKCDDRGQSEAYFDFNTGVVAYRSSESVMALLADWRRLCAEWFRSPPFRLTAVDQHAFRRALWDSSVSVYTLPPEYNYRTILPGRLAGKAKILHGRSKNHERLAAFINRKDGPRIFDRFPADYDWF